jgi:hypothetical protein
MSFFNFGLPPGLNKLLFPNMQSVTPQVPLVPQQSQGLPFGGVGDTYHFNQPIIAATAYHPLFGNLDFSQLQNPSTYQTLSKAAKNLEFQFPPIPGFQGE